ncbi:cadherin repeat domain-containing protein [Sungkyunkwania multivorans]|uniref:Cadherin repeat domain-containing protein n=1 Tax=Sungkyunkwania multivorans TaxID=1173618 RepID=A0ABW3CWP9_9FLAO
MKTLKRITGILLLTSIFILSSCSKDEGPVGPSASDLNITIDENPTNGTVLGTIGTNLSGSLVFTITSQTPTGALAIDTDSGELTVADASRFDFESTTTVEANISVANASETATASVQIDLRNIDDIAFFLTASRASYVNATPGEWIAVTQEEYDALANSLNEVSKCATTDADYNSTTSSVRNTSLGYTWANDDGVNIPNASYVFAIKYRVNSTTDIDGTQIKQSSTDIADGYTDLGGSLPTHSGGINHFVLKGSDTPTTDTGYLAIYSAGGISWNTTGGPYRYANENANTLPLTVNATVLFLYQGLSTTQKQWD